MCFHKGPMKYGEQIALCSRILLCKSSLIIDTCFATWQGEGWSDMNRNHTIDAADGWSLHLRVPCVCMSVRPQCVPPTSPHLHPLPTEPERRADVINVPGVSQWFGECFGRGGRSLDPVKLPASALLFERFFFK